MVGNALTLIAPIKSSDDAAALKTFLEGIGQDIRGNPHVDFSKLATTHFLRWVVVDRDPDFPPQLAFESNHDGTLDQHLDELIAVCGPMLDRIYGRCEGYPAAGVAQPAQVKAYLKAHAIPYAAFYQAYPDRTVKEIQENTAIVEEIQKYLDEHRAALANRPPEEIHRAVAEHLKQRGLPLSPPAASQVTRTEKAVRFFLNRRTLTGLLALPLLGLLSPYLLLLLLRELLDKPAPKKVDNVDKALLAKEDWLVQNQLTHLVTVKPGALRLYTLKTVLRAIEFLARTYYNQGELGGIPTIHFARWALIDGGKRLLFFSNYDGSWENYLGDFIDRASVGLTGVWSNTLGFPKTLLLVFKGARHEDAFKQWTRDHQIPTQVWYSAHASESVQNILNNVAIRAQLAPSPTPEQARAWLARL